MKRTSPETVNEFAKQLPISQDAACLLQRLNQAGYKAYIVGGCVRNLLLNLQPTDYDITTSALPEEVEKAFSDLKHVETGLKHGTVTIILNGNSYEITTFRKDVAYDDHRHPVGVIFSKSLSEDLKRRDFTVNALAYNPNEGLIDQHDGLQDLNNRILKAIGNAEKRFDEDALRILRGLRFASQYDLTIEEQTAKAIHRKKQLLHYLAIERILKELHGIIESLSPVILHDYRDIFEQIIPQLGTLSEKEYDLTVSFMNRCRPDFALRLAILLHDIADYKTILGCLKLDNRSYKRVCIIIENLDRNIEPDKPQLCRILSEIGNDSLLDLLHVQLSCSMISHKKHDAIRKGCKYIIENNICYSLSQLDIKGNDLLKLGYQGSQISQTLQKLLEAVIDEKVLNKKQELIDYLSDIAPVK